MRYKIRHPGTMEWIFGDDKDALEHKWFEGFNRAILNDNPKDVIDSQESEIRELKNQINGLQFELKVSHSVAVENKELREKLEYTENKLGTMLAIDEMLYLRGFSKPTDWSVSNARWKVIVKLQSLAREALSRIRGGGK